MGRELKNKYNNILTNKVSLYYILIKLEGKDKKVLENQLLYMWEQIKAGNYYEATRHWKNEQWRREFVMQATSLNYIDNWVKRLS